MHRGVCGLPAVMPRTLTPLPHLTTGLFICSPPHHLRATYQVYQGHPCLLPQGDPADYLEVTLALTEGETVKGTN